MNLEEKNRSQQDSGRKKGFEYFRLDRKKVSDFFLSIESDQDDGRLTQATEKQQNKEAKEDKSADFFLPE